MPAVLSPDAHFKHCCPLKGVPKFCILTSLPDMEAFSLLKYWRGAAGGGGVVDGAANVAVTTATATATVTGATKIITAVSYQAAETDEDETFFDLEFPAPEGEDNHAGEKRSVVVVDEEDIGTDYEDEREFKFTLLSGQNGERTGADVSGSPSDDMFFRGRLVQVEPSSFIETSEPSSKSQFAASLLRSATMFRVLLLKIKKSKAIVAEEAESNGSSSETVVQKQEHHQQSTPNHGRSQSKFLHANSKDEQAPTVSPIIGDTSSRSSSSSCVQKQSSDEKRFSKDAMQRYLNKVKPLYVRVSKRYGEKLTPSGQVDSGAVTAAELPQVSEAPPECPNVKSQSKVNLQAGLRVVCKHLGKSRSASSAVAAAPSPSRRRDDSLLQQQDGIQSAILHCKRSFNASRGSE